MQGRTKARGNTAKWASLHGSVLITQTVRRFFLPLPSAVCFQPVRGRFLPNPCGKGLVVVAGAVVLAVAGEGFAKFADGGGAGMEKLAKP